MEPQTEPAAKKRVTKKAKKQPSRAVAVHRPMPPAAPPTLDQQIVLAAADPNVDVGKMKALTDLRRQLRMEEAEEQFNLAMTACQAEMRPVEADANNPSTKSKYATLFGVDRALRPIWVKHGFGISFNTADCPLPDHMRVLAYVSRGLYTRTYQYDVAVDTKGARGGDVMTKTHAGGSALSYGKRYVLLMIFNVTIRRGPDQDDDGNAASGVTTITKKQAEELITLLDEAGGDKRKFCVAMGVDGIALIPAADFETAKSRIKAYKLAKAEAHAKAEAAKAAKKAASDFPGDRK